MNTAGMNAIHDDTMVGEVYVVTISCYCYQVRCRRELCVTLTKDFVQSVASQTL